jgi:hypothetical protein
MGRFPLSKGKAGAFALEVTVQFIVVTRETRDALRDHLRINIPPQSDGTYLFQVSDAVHKNLVHRKFEGESLSDTLHRLIVGRELKHL